MKGILIAAVLCVVGMAAGCTMTETTQQHFQRINQQTALQMRMMVEDIDTIFLLDRSTRLTEWDARIGE